MTSAIMPPSRSALRYEGGMAAQGPYAENFPHGAFVGSSALVSQTIYFMTIGLAAGDIVANIHTYVAVLGTGFTGNGLKVGLYSKAGAQLAVSADVSAAFGSAGPKVSPLATPYPVLTTDGYLIAVWQNGSANLALDRGSTTNQGGTFSGASMGAYAAQVTQADLGASQTPTFAGGSSLNFWVGVS